MTAILVTVLGLSIVLLFICRNLVVELVTIKLITDLLVCLVMLLRGQTIQNIGAEAAGWFMLSIGILMGFMFLAAVVRRHGGVE
jgi:hypothetical protein